MRRALFYGLMAAAGSAAWMLLEFVLGLHTTRAEVGRFTGFGGMVFPIAAIVLSLRDARRARGHLGFVSGLRIGAMTGLSYAIITGAAVWSYFSWVNPGFQVDGRSVDVTSQVTLAVVGGLVVCLAVTLISLALMRRPPAVGVLR